MNTTKPAGPSGHTLTGTWRLDPKRSTVEFRVGHFWGLSTVTGSFEDYEGRLDLSADPAIELTINAASLQTGNPKRDRHLRSADFFDAENHPRVRFRSHAVDSHGDGLKVRGSLSARNGSIPLELDAKLLEIDGELEIEAATIAPHRDLGMTWSPLGMIPPRAQLLVKGHLIPGPNGAGGLADRR
jgi:polyisoprenoid-binding protein YceI